MFGNQVFAIGDLGTIGLLVGLEILLSADNAIILALLVRHLGPTEQKRALTIGLALSFVFRAIAIMFASILSGLWWAQLLGGLYLVFLAVKHFLPGHTEKDIKVSGASFQKTVFIVGLADVAFAIDSVLVAVATEPHKEKIWVVYAGALSGVIALRWAATVFLKLLERFPSIESMAYLLVGWAGLKLSYLSLHTFEHYWEHDLHKTWPLGFHFQEAPTWLFWGGVAAIVLWGFWKAKQDKPDSPEADVIEEAEEVWEDSTKTE